MNIKKRLRDCSRLKECKKTLQLKATQNSELDLFFFAKETIMEFGKT